MTPLERSVDVIHYDYDPVWDDYSISRFGYIKPIWPVGVRERESKVRQDVAERIAPLLIQGLIEAGVPVQKIVGGGSAATGFAGPGSDIDLVVHATGWGPYSQATPEYLQKERELDEISHNILMCPDVKALCPFAVDVHLPRDYQHPQFKKTMERKLRHR